MGTAGAHREHALRYLWKMIHTVCSCCARERAQLEGELDQLQYLAKQLKKNYMTGARSDYSHI